jgi:hypothetical protein
MKRIFLLFFLSIIIGKIYSQNLSFGSSEYVDANDRETSFIFYDGFRVKGYKNGNTQAGYHNGSYVITEEHGINYLIILWDDKTWDKYLMIARIYSNSNIHDLYFYNADDYPFFSGGTVPNREYITFYPHIVRSDILSASSSLKEGSKVYSTDNLTTKIGVCWAEGVRGHGIGEKIIFKNNGNNLSFDLSISTGFVSFEKPYLYRENSRPKKIRISFEGDDPRIIELADTPNLQSLGGVYGAGKKDLWVEILEVYPGTKYTDTCVNFFQGLFSQ